MATPAGSAGVDRLRLSTRSVAIAVGLFGLTLVLLRLLAAASRVIGWMLVAAAVAGLLYPLVDRLARRMPRGVAVLLVVLAAAATIGAVGYGLVGDVRTETRNLQRAAPEAAARIEEEGRFSTVARTIALRERTERFLAEAPDLLSGGGTPAERFRAAATRGVAFLTTSVLTLFLLLHGPRIARAALAQVHDDARRVELERIARDAYSRGFGYARGTLLLAGLAGGFAFILARAAGVPGAAALAVWVALWDVVPVVGAVVGAAPIVVLAAVASPGRGVVLGVAFVAYQVLEDLVLQRQVERRTLRLGPFLTLFAGLLGLELRGAPGALLAVLLVAVVVAVLDDAAPPLPEGPAVPVP